MFTTEIRRSFCVDDRDHPFYPTSVLVKNTPSPSSITPFGSIALNASSAATSSAEPASGHDGMDIIAPPPALLALLATPPVAV